MRHVNSRKERWGNYWYICMLQYSKHQIQTGISFSKYWCIAANNYGGACNNGWSPTPCLVCIAHVHWMFWKKIIDLILKYLGNKRDKCIIEIILKCQVIFQKLNQNSQYIRLTEMTEGTQTFWRQYELLLTTSLRVLSIGHPHSRILIWSKSDLEITEDII